jgi:Ala-tRNA(Pro) deacylase
MTTERVKRFLEEAGTHYDAMPHREAFTAQAVAEASAVSGQRVAKVVIATTHDGRYLMAVLPAPCRIDLSALRDAAGARHLSLAGEAELSMLFPDCDLGAMPPFGALYDMPVYVDACFSRTGEFFFQAGDHRELLRMRYEDFERLARPVVREFCRHELDRSRSAA